MGVGLEPRSWRRIHDPLGDCRNPRGEQLPPALRGRVSGVGEEGANMSEPIAAPKRAPLELKLRVMLRNWSYPEFREILYREARECESYACASVYKRVYCYMRVMELVTMGLPTRKIEGLLKREVGYAPARDVIGKWRALQSSPLNNMAVFDVRRPEVGFIVGALVTDGSEAIKVVRGIIDARSLWFYNKSTSFIEDFRAACRVLGLSSTVMEQTSGLGSKLFKVNVSSTLLYLLVKRYDEFIPRTLDDVQLAFLRAAWLGDGHISENLAQFTNTDEKLLSVVETILSRHGVKYARFGPYRPSKLCKKPVYKLGVSLKSLHYFLKLTGLAESPPRSTGP